MNDGIDPKSEASGIKEKSQEVEEEKDIKNAKAIKDLRDIKELEENSTTLSKEKLYKFVTLSTDGLLNHYEPTFKNIEKDIERLNLKQEVLSVDISTEIEKLRKSTNEVNLGEMISVTGYYKEKIDQLKECMTSLSERSVSLRERACRLQEQKQEAALKREIKRAADQAREQHLIAKGDSSSQRSSRESLSTLKSSSGANLSAQAASGSSTAGQAASGSSTAAHPAVSAQIASSSSTSSVPAEGNQASG